MLDIRKIKKRYDYLGEGSSWVELIVGDESYFGSAFCAPKDKEFASEKVGLTIAEKRAEIKYLQSILQNTLKPQLKILEHLENGVNAKPEKDRNGIMIYRAANRCRNEIKSIRYNIKILKKELKEYIDNKDDLYNKIIARRSKEVITTK